MKKHFLLLALLVTIGIGAKAQFTLGIKGGVNFSKLNTDNLTESSVTGYDAGIWARFGKGLYLQPELYVSSVGGKFDFHTNNNTVTETGEQKFTTLNVPLLIGQSFGSKDLNFRVMAGPIYSYVLSANDNYSTAVANAYHDFGNYNHSTIGFQAGAGIDLGFLSFDARYEGGLSKFNDTYGQRASLWQLSVGFKIL